jgi:hypothetical protein
MLQELAAGTRASAWAIGSMLFFLAAWLAVVVWLVRQRPADLEAQSRLPLEGEPAGVKSQESRVESPEPRVESPESRVESAEFGVESPESRVESPESRVESPEFGV